MLRHLQALSLQSACWMVDAFAVPYRLWNSLELTVWRSHLPQALIGQVCKGRKVCTVWPLSSCVFFHSSHNHHASHIFQVKTPWMSLCLFPFYDSRLLTPHLSVSFHNNRKHYQHGRTTHRTNWSVPSKCLGGSSLHVKVFFQKVTQLKLFQMIRWAAFSIGACLCVNGWMRSTM